MFDDDDDGDDRLAVCDLLQTLMFPNQDHGRMSVSDDGTLTIEPVQRADAGQYICKGLSIAGSAYAKARLDVRGSTFYALLSSPVFATYAIWYGVGLGPGDFALDGDLGHPQKIMQGTMPGARRRGRPRTAWIDNIKSWTGLSVEESIRMTDDRDKFKKTSMVWPTLGSRTAKEQNRTTTQNKPKN